MKGQMIFQSSIGFFQDKGVEGNPFGLKERRYHQIYLLLKSQYNVLEGIQKTLISYLESPSVGELSSIAKTLVDELTPFLQSSYGDLENNSQRLMNQLRKFNTKTTNNQGINKLLNGVFMATATVSRLISKQTPSTKKDFAPPSDFEFEQEISPLSILESNNDDVMICRICDAKVPLSMIEEHTNSCIASFQKEAKINVVHEKMLNLYNQICENQLNIKWPSGEEVAVKCVLPTILLASKLRRALELDIKSSDTPAELEYLTSQLITIANDGTVPETKFAVKKLIIDKTQLCTQLQQAMEVLRQTRVSHSIERDAQPLISDFDFIKRISSGAYARVFLAKKKTTGDIYAIKVQNKNDIQQKNQMKRIMAEKNILFTFNNPYLINFYYSIIGKENLYLVMEYLPGGDLYSLLQKVGAIDENSARLYTWEIAQALKYLHDNGIIHRDLKPDNILISAEGTLKLTDFGLSYLGVADRQQASDSIVQSSSLVGTPDYIAPEILLCQPHTFTVDYWSLGCMVYEFLTGVPPFHAENEKETYENILRGEYDPLTEDDCSPECADFISRLLSEDPNRRLGALGSDEVFAHPWLRGVRGDEEPPFVPQITSDTSTEYFEERPSVFVGGDADIQTDMQATVRAPSWARRLSDVSSSLTRESNSDDLSEFPSVQMSQLGQVNLGEARRLSRARASSFVTDLPLPEGAEDGRAHSVAGARPVNKRQMLQLPRGGRRRGFTAMNSSDDSVINFSRPPIIK